MAQFKIPAGDGDSRDAELAIFNFGAGGGVDANIKRWIGQFQSKNRKVNVTTGQADQGEYVIVEVSGIYNQPDGPPILRKTKPVPGSRMLAVILTIPQKGVYYLKLTGSDKTVANQSAAIRASFGGDSKGEKEYEFDS